MVGLDNMWANAGEQQFHLPTRPAQVIPGHIGVVVPDLTALQERLKGVEKALAGTRFAWSVKDGYVAATCPWGNRFRCYAPQEKFGAMTLGIPYVELLVRPGAAAGIARFYQQVFGAPAAVSGKKKPLAAVSIGPAQTLYFRETEAERPDYDGHHIAVYVANVSAAYAFLDERELVTERLRNHQFRFQQIVDPSSGDLLAELEHEVRGLHHPMAGRRFVNRNPSQSLRAYVRGQDALHVV
jgi:hypothetical protein